MSSYFYKNVYFGNKDILDAIKSKLYGEAKNKRAYSKGQYIYEKIIKVVRIEDYTIQVTIYLFTFKRCKNF